MFGRNMLWLFGMMFFAVSWTAAQEGSQPVPTLVPPTPVPVVSGGIDDALLSQSALVQIVERGVLRVGTLFNEPPFGELNIRGEVVGFDAALARAMGELWGVDVEFVQVTRQNAHSQLIQGQVDVLLAAQVHYRDLDDAVEYSQTYYAGQQSLMVRLDDAAESLGDMNNRRIASVMGADSEKAVAYWQERFGATLVIQSYLTIDQAIVALVSGEVDGIVDKRYRLRELVDPDRTRVLDAVVQPEPYGAVFRRQDIHLRNAFNQALQFLVNSGQLADIYSEYFPSSPLEDGAIYVWRSVPEELPALATYGTDIVYPQQYTLSFVQSTGTLRVAGLPETPPESPESERRIAQSHLQLVQRLANQLGVSVQIVPGSVDDPIGFVERGEADIAVGVQPDWSQVNRVDFTAPYLLRGKRLLVQTRDDYTSFSDLRGQWVGVFASEPGAADEVNSLASSINAGVNIFTLVRDEDAAFEMLVETNVDVVYGDSVRLLPHLEANPETLKLSERCVGCDPWYTREYLALAVPRNDIDFRLVVEYALQDAHADGSLAGIMAPVSVPDDVLSVQVWPGVSQSFGMMSR